MLQMRFYNSSKIIYRKKVDAAEKHKDSIRNPLLRSEHHREYKFRIGLRARRIHDPVAIEMNLLRQACTEIGVSSR